MVCIFDFRSTPPFLLVYCLAHCRPHSSSTVLQQSSNVLTASLPVDPLLAFSWRSYPSCPSCTSRIFPHAAPRKDCQSPRFRLHYKISNQHNDCLAIATTPPFFNQAPPTALVWTSRVKLCQRHCPCTTNLPRLDGAAKNLHLQAACHGSCLDLCPIFQSNGKGPTDLRPCQKHATPLWYSTRITPHELNTGSLSYICIILYILVITSVPCCMLTSSKLAPTTMAWQSSHAMACM